MVMKEKYTIENFLDKEKSPKLWAEIIETRRQIDKLEKIYKCKLKDIPNKINKYVNEARNKKGIDDKIHDMIHNGAQGGIQGETILESGIKFKYMILEDFPPKQLKTLAGELLKDI